MNYRKLASVFNPLFRNKYLFTAAIFIVWVTFFDRDNIVDRIQNMHELEKIRKENAYYNQQIIEDQKSLKHLEDKDFLEKFAREEHHMKRDNEDIFIVVEE